MKDPISDYIVYCPESEHYRLVYIAKDTFSSTFRVAKDEEIAFSVADDEYVDKYKDDIISSLEYMTNHEANTELVPYIRELIRRVNNRYAEW